MTVKSWYSGPEDKVWLVVRGNPPSNFEMQAYWTKREAKRAKQPGDKVMPLSIYREGRPGD